MSLETSDEHAGAFSRRAFIGKVGAGAGALAASGTFGLFAAPPARSQFAATSPVVFGRMFPDLGPANSASDRVRAALRDIGKPGGILDAADNLARRPGRADRRSQPEPEQPEQPARTPRARRSWVSSSTTT